MTDYSIDALDSHSVNEFSIDAGFTVNPKIPFCGRHFNRPRVSVSTNSPTATVDTYAKDMDINVIVRKHMLTGAPLPSIDEAVYGIDVSVEDYVQKFQAAKDAFMDLPSNLRAKFNNDVQNFSEFLSTSSDATVSKVLKEFGLVKEDVKPAVGDTTTVITPEPVETQQPTIKEDLSAS